MRSFVVEDGNDGSLQFRLHFEVKGLLHRKKLKILKMMGGDCCDVFVFSVRKDGQPDTVMHYNQICPVMHFVMLTSLMCECRFRPRCFL